MRNKRGEEGKEEKKEEEMKFGDGINGSLGSR